MTCQRFKLMKRVLTDSNTITALPSKLSQKRFIYEISYLETQFEDQLRTVVCYNSKVSAFVKWKESAPFSNSMPSYSEQGGEFIGLVNTISARRLKLYRFTLYNWWMGIPSFEQNNWRFLCFNDILLITNYMFRPSGGHHQVFEKSFLKRKQAKLHFLWFWDSGPS
jgi:hypothetical protein